VHRAISFILLSALSFGGAQSKTQDRSKPATTGIDSSRLQVASEVAEAESAIVKSDWKVAEAKLDAWLGTHPSDARALFDAGYVADAQNHIDVAIGLYRRAVNANPSSFEAHLSLGLLLARQGKETDARSELQTATSLDPGDAGPALKARAWRALAQIDMPSPGNPGDPTEASNELLQALKLSPETPADTLMAASLAEASGQFDIAEAAYRRLLISDPKSAEANAGLAHLLIKRKRYPEAETLIRQALEAAPDNPALNAQLATVLAAQDKAEALPQLEKLHDAHPDDRTITHMLADVLAEAGDAANSDKLYVALLATSPEDPALLLAHGQNLTRQLRYAEALTVFDKATRVDPSNGDAWSGMAFAASKMRQPTLAIHALTMRSRFLPEVPATYFLWATSYDTLHDRVAAATYYHHFLDSASGKFPDQEWQARQRLLILERK
jgi:tetratricopeptide (TPR) repeat protein